jgi:predicted cation transporter
LNKQKEGICEYFHRTHIRGSNPLFGLLSSFISVIVTAVLLSEIVLALNLDRCNRKKMAVLNWFAVGLGAIVTPVDGPLSPMLVQ